MFRFLGCVCFVTFCSAAWAQPAYFESLADGRSLDGWFQTELRFNQLDAFSVDNVGTRSDQRRWQTGLMRLGLRYVPNPSVEFTVAGEVRSNRLWGDESRFGLEVDEEVFRQPRDADQPRLIWMPRALNLKVMTAIGQLSCGHQAIDWGTGFLVNGGARDVDFGDGWSANLVERCAFGSKPFSAVPDLTIFIAGDLVWRDENAELLDGDRAFGGTLGVLYKTTRLTIGNFNAYRYQSDRDDPLFPEDESTYAKVLTTDIYVRWRMYRGLGGRQITWASEAALIVGKTTRPYLEETYADGASVQGVGALTHLIYEDQHLTAKFESGYASGDDDSRDDTVRVFSFHSSHQVGMILFDHVLPLMSARSVDRLMDRDLLNVPPPSTRFTVAQGGVTNAYYVHPVVKLRPYEFLEFRLGYVYARSAADFIDMYQTGIRGGYNTTVGGQQPGGRGLGHEFDFGMHYTFFGRQLAASTERLRLRAGFEAANWIPGDAFAGVIEGPLYMTRLLFGLRW
ncbi:MAG: hypothetical protein VX589_04145 [Myxococcota bacterium]|nr:hypothetical protein [Myxococcota bacterium]